jgi:hypothetical protein
MAVREMKKEVIIHRVRNGDGVYISPMGTTMTLRENHESLTFMPVSTVLRRWDNFVLSAF